LYNATTFSNSIKVHQSAIENIRRSLRRLNQSYGISDDRKWKQFGITYALSQVLFVLAELPTPIAKQVSEALKLEKSTVSRFLDKLHAKNLVKYAAHPADARARVIILTQKGRELLTQLNQFGNARTRQALQGLTTREIVAIEVALTKLELNLIGKRCL
jgi:DNA-binding MarR family transcriptional regulator